MAISLDWRLESTLLATRALEDETESAVSILAEALRSVITAYVIVERRHPTPQQVRDVLRGFGEAPELIKRAVREACGRKEKAAAKRCDGWAKCLTVQRHDRNTWIHGFARWVDANPEEGTKKLEPLTGDTRLAAVEEVGWEADIDEHHDTDQWTRFTEGLKTALERTDEKEQQAVLRKVMLAAQQARPRGA